MTSMAPNSDFDAEGIRIPLDENSKELIDSESKKIEDRREAIRLRLEGVAEDVKAARDDGSFPIGFKRRVADAIEGIELLQELLHRADYVPEVEVVEGSYD